MFVLTDVGMICGAEDWFCHNGSQRCPLNAFAIAKAVHIAIATATVVAGNVDFPAI
jgi:hypothetical protein